MKYKIDIWVRLILSIFFIVMGLAFYHLIFSQPFSANPVWLLICHLITAGFTIVVWGWFCLPQLRDAFLPVNHYLKQEDIKASLIVAVVTPLLIYIFIVMGVGYGGATLATALFGHPYESAIYIADKDALSKGCSRGRGTSYNKYKIKSEHIRRVGSSICISNDLFLQLPDEGFIKVGGNESILGRIVIVRGIDLAIWSEEEKERMRSELKKFWN